MCFSLKESTSDTPEVLALLRIITEMSQTCRVAARKLTRREAGNTLYGLRGLNSNEDAVQELVGALVVLVARGEAWDAQVRVLKL